MNVLFILIIVLFQFNGIVRTLHWLGFTHPSNHTWTIQDCHHEVAYHNIRTVEQHLFCCKNTQQMSIISRSNDLTKEACKTMLYMHRWNCSRIDRIQYGALPFELKEDTAESAFVHALSAASITFRYAKMCYKNKDCSCGQNGFHWLDTAQKEPIKLNKCANYLKKGVKFAKRFALSVYPVDSSKDRKINKSNRVKRYNQRIGRQAVEQNRKIKCECIGTSVNCAARICYKKIPAFKEVVHEIVEKYKQVSNTQSEQIKQKQQNNRNKYNNKNNNESDNRSDIRAYSPGKYTYLQENSDQSQDTSQYQQLQERTSRLSPTKTKLKRLKLIKTINSSSNYELTVIPNTKVFKVVENEEKPLKVLTYSPNYCDRNETLGIFGTQGRLCNMNTNNRSSCKTLCCGRGFRMKRYVKNVNCRCRYIHCCQIKCDTCQILQTDYICK